MKIGVPKEIKSHEYRVGLTPASVYELIRHGSTVYVEQNAGAGIGFFDQDYIAAGATVLPCSKDVFASSDMIIKVKEPQEHECAQLREGQILFTFLHLAPDSKQAEALIRSRSVAIAYETVTDSAGGLPLLTPMSEIAGRMSIQVGAHYLEKAQGGRGVLLGGACGIEKSRVVILGGGVVGTNAARMALGLGADVTIVDNNQRRLYELDHMFSSRVHMSTSTHEAISRLTQTADLVVGGVLVAGDAAPKLLTREMVSKMQKGSVVVDVAIDQGGCFETSRPTSHENPVYEVDGVIHYCVTNMPGAVARTSTGALNNAVLPFALLLANHGINALLMNSHLKRGANVMYGHIVHPAVAKALGYSAQSVDGLVEHKRSLAANM